MYFPISLFFTELSWNQESKYSAFRIFLVHTPYFLRISQFPYFLRSFHGIKSLNTPHYVLFMFPYFLILIRRFHSNRILNIPHFLILLFHIPYFLLFPLFSPYFFYTELSWKQESKYSASYISVFIPWIFHGENAESWNAGNIQYYYCIQGNFRPRFFFGLFRPLNPRANLKRG